MKTILINLFLVLLASQSACAEKMPSPADQAIELETVVSGLQRPWSLEFLPDGRILVTEKAGQLRIIKDGQLQSEPIAGVPAVNPDGQGGLLDIALDADFANNERIYLSYSNADDRTGTEVISARFVDNQLVDQKIIFTLLPKTGSGHHFGSRLVQADDGNLFITTGDRGDRPRAQNLDDHAGSLIRIKPDGTIPDDNPFIGKAGSQPEIYTYGNRNMQGIDIHPVTREVWTVEHGPQGGDELNRMQAGINYGWPVITYGKNYGIGTSIGEGTAKPGMEQPVHYWVPSIATSGLLFYTGDRFPGWKHNAFVSSLRYGALARLEIKDNKVVSEERLINGTVGRIRDVKQGLDGLLYIITDEQDGKLIRIKPAPSTP